MSSSKRNAVPPKEKRARKPRSLWAPEFRQTQSAASRSKWLEEELRTLEAAFKKASKSRESALEFLVEAGIATPSGRLSKTYR